MSRIILIFAILSLLNYSNSFSNEYWDHHPWHNHPWHHGYDHDGSFNSDEGSWHHDHDYGWNIDCDTDSRHHDHDHDYDRDHEHDWSDEDFRNHYYDHYESFHDYEHTIQEKITKIVRKYSTADFSFRKYCKENTPYSPKITRGTAFYTIKYTLPDTINLNVTVITQNGLIITNVKGKGHFKGFKDIRILPEMLDLQKGSWSFMNNDLTIILPYKVPLGSEYVAECLTENSVVNIKFYDPTLDFQLRNNFE